MKKTIRKIITEAKYTVQDVADKLTGKSDPLVPTRKRLSVTARDAAHYRATGQKFLGYFKDVGGLKPAHKVLEIGCGYGEKLVPLTGYLSAEGEFHGLDIVADRISWCQNAVGSRFENFHFQLIDVQNDMYQLEKGESAAHYRLPFDDNYFDFVYLTSVFTHMRPAEVAAYLKEIGRVMKPGAKSLITYFVMDKTSMEYMAKGGTRLNFQHKFDGFLSTSMEVPERAIGFEEDWVRQVYQDAKLEIDEPIRYGSWSNRPDHLGYQDIVIATKP